MKLSSKHRAFDISDRSNDLSYSNNNSSETLKDEGKNDKQVGCGDINVQERKSIIT